MGDHELPFVEEAFETNWVAPVGPHVDAFEREFAETVGADHAVALSSGTAALHLAVRLSGIGQGDEVLVSSLTFCASVNPILYEGAVPVFVDSETESWNLDPNLVEDLLKRRDQVGRLPKALVAVHLYGQCADIDALAEVCDRFGLVLIEDAAEALGARYWGKGQGERGKGQGERGKGQGGGGKGEGGEVGEEAVGAQPAAPGLNPPSSIHHPPSSPHPGPRASAQSRSPGVFGRAGVFSFNGNKIITTSGGGMLVTADGELAAHARKLATQAREPAPHYEHAEIG